MYQYLNTQNTAVMHTETSRCLYLDQPSTIHTLDYFNWVAEGNTPLAYVAPPAPTPATAAQMWERIKTERDHRKASGVLVGTKWFHTDADSRIQQLGLMMMGAGIPNGLQWKTMDGSFVTMTQALAGQIFGAVAASDQAIFGKAEWHKAQMMAAPIPGNYDFSGGWPAVFTG